MLCHALSYRNGTKTVTTDNSVLFCYEKQVILQERNVNLLSRKTFNQL